MKKAVMMMKSQCKKKTTPSICFGDDEDEGAGEFVLLSQKYCDRKQIWPIAVLRILFISNKYTKKRNKTTQNSKKKGSN